ncbi:MAG TPA: hydroxypyruvate isomerase [Candidatus Polarisedimenticolia bacterium]|nr:hydroxypyruvate isomerase [Candidatus Polarisedimenticolia bacterium]
MPRFAANLTMLFTEVPFLERFRRAREAGFTCVEYLLPYDYSIKELKTCLEENGLKQVLFNLPCGDWAAGDRGIGARPDRVAEFCAGVEMAIEYAKALGVTQLNCLAGKSSPQFTEKEHWNALVENIHFAGTLLHQNGLTLVVEAVNHFDLPGFFLNRTEQVLKLLEDVGLPNVGIQYDLYHAQREEGEIAGTLRNHMARIRHIQVADNPGRHQPGTGEIDYPFIFKEIDALGYQGYVGLEYIPKPDSNASFAWIEEFGFKR